MSAHVLPLFSCVHSLGLGLDLGNRLDRRERESARALVHGSQSFRQKAAGLYLTTHLNLLYAAREKSNVTEKFKSEKT